MKQLDDCACISMFIGVFFFPDARLDKGIVDEQRDRTMVHHYRHKSPPYRAR